MAFVPLGTGHLCISPYTYKYFVEIKDVYFSYIPRKETQRERDTESNTTDIKITGINNLWSLISIHINVLNSPIKSLRLTKWMGKQDPPPGYIQERHLRSKGRSTFNKCVELIGCLYVENCKKILIYYSAQSSSQSG